MRSGITLLQVIIVLPSPLKFSISLKRQYNFPKYGVIIEDVLRYNHFNGTDLCNFLNNETRLYVYKMIIAKKHIYQLILNWMFPILFKVYDTLISQYGLLMIVK